MPYNDSERRKAAARKWRVHHRAERAAYMRRYRRARSSGRGRGRPRSLDTQPDPRARAPAEERAGRSTGAVADATTAPHGPTDEPRATESDATPRPTPCESLPTNAGYDGDPAAACAMNLDPLERVVLGIP